MPLPKNLPRSAQRSAPSKPPEAKENGELVVFANRYKVESKLGSGAFGCALLVSDLSANGEKRVLKKIVVTELQPDETVDAVREARLLAKLDHPAIVRFHDSFMEKDVFCIVTEYCEGGDLNQKIKQRSEAGKTFSESLILDWFIQLSTALKYIHERRILHRDLKTSNIFLKNNLIKLGDFGISRILMGTSDLATTFTGTPYYMSPEVLKHDGYNIKSDIWSLGAVLYELCTLQHAFQGQNLMAIMYKIVEGDPPRLPDHFNPHLRTLFERLMNKDPSKRPTAVEILQDSYVHSHLEGLSHKVLMKLTTATKAEEEAEAIARALSPVRKKQLVPMEEDSRVLSPREKMQLRKQKMADQEAEDRRRLAAKNFSESKQRYHEKKKKEAKVVPPWVEEHPDVFKDADFSSTVSDNTMSDMEVSQPPMHLQQQPPSLLPPQPQQAAMYVQVDPPTTNGDIPDDPMLAETHYSQFDDFEAEADSSGSESEDDLEAFLGCINDALDIQAPPLEMAVEPPQLTCHEDISPFTPIAREKRIQLLRMQCQQIYGAENFQKVYEYMKRARNGGAVVNEEVLMSDLRKIVSNTRDCFLVDQLVFLEKQTSFF